MLFLALAGCTYDNSFEGTWIFFFDYEAESSGDCAGGQDTGWGGGDYTYEGTTSEMVNIYSTATGEYVVALGYAEPLVGEVKGSDLTASYELKATSDGYVATEKYTLDGTLKSGELSGEYAYETAYTSGSDSYSCTQTQNYTAVRSTTTQDELASPY